MLKIGTPNKQMEEIYKEEDDYAFLVLNPMPHLDQILSELYDLSKPGADKQRISGLLDEYRKMTGKNKPEFMA